jgi:hypothetical protein
LAYLIIGIVLLVVLAPIFAILPSKRQKQQMQMRKLAMAKGIRVDLVKIEDPHPDREKYITSTGKPLDPVMDAIAWRIPRPRPRNWRLLPVLDWSVIKAADAPGFSQGWVWEVPCEHLTDEFSAFLTAHLPKLPDDVVRVEELKYTISLYWHERCDEQTVQQIVDFLVSCRDLPSHADGDDFDRSE